MEANLLYIVIGVAVVALFAVLWLVWLELRLKKVFRGKKAADLESLMAALGEDFKKLDLNREETEKYLETVEKRLRGSIQTINTIRFNPFESSGSNQSFATAFLDERGDGVVLSSLYSREGVRVYAKPIKNKKSEYALSEEEKEAIEAGK